jgi:geranylgeranyl pyrophosphate synthase
MNFPQLVAETRERVEAALDHRLPAEGDLPSLLHRAMRYSALDGGKRVRPLLVYAAGQAVGVPPEQLDAAACAVELIHVYSLVHDDLPAMDDDDLRRGKPTCHKAFDEATAVLVGDALQSLAFEVLATDTALAVPGERRAEMIAELARASGSRGMVGGQAIDIAAAGTRLDLDALQTMHRMKTGALIAVSVRLGALAAPQVEQAQLNALERYATAIGLAFQIQDDILDVEGDTATLGKPQGSDNDSNKPTYTSLLGLAGAKAKAREVHREAVEALEAFAEEAAPLRALADYIIERTH